MHLIIERHAFMSHMYASLTVFVRHYWSELIDDAKLMIINEFNQPSVSYSGIDSSSSKQDLRRAKQLEGPQASFASRYVTRQWPRHR